MNIEITARTDKIIRVMQEMIEFDEKIDWRKNRREFELFIL